MEPGKHSHRRERQSQDGSAQGLATLPAGPPGSLVSGLCDSSVPSASMLVDSACAFLGLTWDSPRCYCAQPSVVLARVLAAEGRVRMDARGDDSCFLDHILGQQAADVRTCRVLVGREATEKVVKVPGACRL